MHSHGKFERNIRILSWMAPFQTLSISMTYLVPLFVDRGLSVTQITYLQSFFAAVVVFADVPGGYVADRIGRARSIKLSLPAMSIAMVVYAFSNSYGWLMVSEALLGLGSCLFGGVDTALIADSLRAEGQTGDRLTGNLTAAQQRIKRNYFAGQAGGAVAALGLFALGWPRITLLADAVMLMVGFGFACQLVEAPHHIGEQPELCKSIRKAMRDVWMTFVGLLRKPQSCWLLVLFVTLNTATYHGAWLSALFYQHFGLPTMWIAIPVFARGLLRSGFAHLSKRQRRTQRNMVFCSSLLGLSYVGLALAVAHYNVWLLIGLVGLDAVFAIQSSALVSRFNEYFDSEYRATLNSVTNLAQRASFGLTGLLVGPSVDHLGLSTTCWSLAVAACPLALFALRRLHQMSTFH